MKTWEVVVNLYEKKDNILNFFDVESIFGGYPTYKKMYTDKLIEAIKKKDYFLLFDKTIKKVKSPTNEDFSALDWFVIICTSKKGNNYAVLVYETRTHKIVVTGVLPKEFFFAITLDNSALDTIMFSIVSPKSIWESISLMTNT